MVSVISYVLKKVIPYDFLITVKVLKNVDYLGSGSCCAGADARLPSAGPCCLGGAAVVEGLGLGRGFRA